MDGAKALPRIGVGAVIWRGDEVLLVRRAKMPRAGEWSLPGGRQETGETVSAALIREVREETSVEIEVLGLIDVVDAIFPANGDDGGYHYTLIDFSARFVSGEARAGDDASEVAWVPLGQLPRYEMWSQTLRIVEQSARLHGPLADGREPRSEP